MASKKEGAAGGRRVVCDCEPPAVREDAQVKEEDKASRRGEMTMDVAHALKQIEASARPHFRGRRPRLKLITLPWELSYPALSLAALAAVTPSCFDISIVDLVREKLFFDEEVDLVGITASTARINAAYALARMYRARGVKVVLGGHHVTVMPEEALEHADAVVVGEGESSWVRICDEFLTDPNRVSGIYRDLPPDLSTLPQPRMDLIKIDRYGSVFYPVIASRGCPAGCSFCFAKRMTKGFRTYPISHVIEQIRRRPQLIRGIYFVDDNLPGDPEYARELFRELRKLNVLFGMQARLEYALDIDALHKAREAGCVLYSSGYESVAPDSLKGTNKRITLDTQKEATKNIHQAGIISSGNWMFGFDWDTPDIFDRTLQALDDLELMHASFTSEIPYPGTASWKKFHREGRLVSYNYDDYLGKDHVVFQPKQMSVEELQQGIRKVVKGFYSPRRSLGHVRRGMANEQLLSQVPKWYKAAFLTALGVYQCIHWNYHFTPSTWWLSQRVLSVYKYRYFGDLLKGTNFWSPNHPRFDQIPGTIEHSYETESPFLHRAGFKTHLGAPLTPD